MKGGNMEKLQILIIDDDPGLRKTLADILTANGYETAAAKDGREGLELLNRYSVNLALIDLGLPDISGIDLLERIKAGSPFTEAIVLTGNATLDSAIEATNRGAFSYIVKPYEPEQLLLHIRRAFEKQRAEENIASHNIELKRINAELETINAVSLAISREIEMEGLLTEVLRTLTEMEIFRFERKGAAFLVEGDKLHLVSQIGLSATQLECCKDLRIGECLCGLAAATGEIIISGNSREDARFTMQIPGMSPHGHVILPLKSFNRIIGVISLDTQPDALASEHLCKLLTTIGNQIAIAVNNAMLYEETRTLSLHDPLTNLPNRRSLDVQMEKCIKTAKRYCEKFSLIMLDIDHFKQYNDRYGHPAGDKILVRLAGILENELRSSDHVFRYGGEEFLAILPRTELEMACDVAERLRMSVESGAGVTISLGVSSFREIPCASESLIIMADAALYQAKKQGRNRVVANKRA
jgi:two-component system cell cycle response regulator